MGATASGGTLTMRTASKTAGASRLSGAKENRLMANHPNCAKAAERHVLVTTEHKGVFAGWASDTNGDTIKLRAARCCIYWPVANQGFLGLAKMGPVIGARVGPPADIELRAISCVAEITPEATQAWESFAWSR